VFVTQIDDTWGADLIDMQLYSKFNKGYRYLLTIIDVFSKFAWVIPLKTKAGTNVVKAFEAVFKKGRKPNKIWVDQGSEFYNKSFKNFLAGDILLYNTFNEGKSVVIERFNRTLKSLMWKYFSEKGTYKYIDILPDLVERYNNTFHRSIGMTPVEASKKENQLEVFSRLYNDEFVEEKPKFKVGDKVRIAKLKKKFEKGYTPNWSEEIFIIDKIKKTTPLTYNIVDLKGEEIKGSFYKEELQKTKQELFRIEKIIRKRGDMAFVKWKGYDTRFNQWIPLKDIQ